MSGERIELSDRFARTEAERREERRSIGFVRQRMTRWLDPKLLAAAAVEVGVSSAFGRLADKREALEPPAGAADYAAGRDELWLDFLSDTGDGFHSTQTMAWLLAQQSLLGLPRGELLVLGGDQVYPSASVEAYEDHFLGPFSAALWSAEEAAAPEVWAVPGNHDWYDGLTSFLRVFCREGGWAGGWRTKQKCSYFALRLPHNWWLWAIDIQFDTYLDTQQLEYFEDVGSELGEHDRVILVTAKPSWVRAEDDLTEPVSWRYLSYFEEKYVKATGARLAATLTGDLHHYSRYQPADDREPVRITAGGGGAYLSPTHTLPDTLRLRSLHSEQSVGYARETIYPDKPVSERMRRGAFKLGIKNPGFGWLMTGVYGLLAATSLAAVASGRGGLVANARLDGFVDYLGAAFGGGTIVVVVLLAGVLIGYVDAPWWAKLPLGPLQLALHLLLLEGVLYLLLLEVFSTGSSSFLAFLAGMGVAVVLGYVAGPLVFALFLVVIGWARRGKARRHDDHAFASQAIEGYKNFLRLHVGRDGTLTIHPLKVQRVCSKWDVFRRPGEHARPAFEPRPGDEPRAEPIEPPIPRR